MKCMKRSPGCNYNGEDLCISCDDPFVFRKGKCLIEGCLVYSNNGCKQCNYPFTPTKQNTCAIPHCSRYENGDCIACDQGYVKNSIGLCYREDPNCYLYNEGRTACNKCIKGYRFDSNGQCEYADEHCWDFTADGVCMNCDRIYFLDQYNKCQIRDPNCRSYVNGYCSQCKPYFFSQGAFCLANLKGCLDQKSIDQCVQCENGYNMVQGNKCVVNIDSVNWNSIDMDFFDSNTEQEQTDSHNTFTIGKGNKVNLKSCLSNHYGKIYHSSCSTNDANFQVDSTGD